MAKTLREYLIALGFKVDEQSYKKFNEHILGTSKNVMKLGSEAVGAATAVGYAVEKVARQFEELYYLSQRSGASVIQLKAYEFGNRQIGISAEAARSSVEGMAAAIRTNPGLAGLLRGMGIDTGNAQQAVTQLVGKMKSMFGEGGYFVAQNLAGMFGLDEQTFRQMWVNYDRLKEAEEDHKQRARAAGVETEDTTKKFVEFSRALNRLEDDFGILGHRIAQDFVTPALAAVEAIDKIIQSINQLDKKTGGAVGTAGTIVGSGLSIYLAKKWLGNFLKFGKTAAAPTAEAAAPAAEEGLLAAIGAGFGRWALRGLGPIGILLGSTTSTAGEEDDSPLSEAFRRKHGSPGAALLRGGNDATTKALQFFQAQGWSREAAAGLVANLFRESKLNPRAIGDNGAAVGAGQWHGDRQQAFRQLFGKDLRDASLQEQLAFVQHELTKGSDFGARRAGDLLKSVTSAREAGELVSRLYERPQDQFGEAAARGRLAESYLSANLGEPPASKTVTITQKTDIHVAAGPNALATAENVVGAQTRVNGDLVRNTTGAFQ